jgi:hypothetical protein
MTQLESFLFELSFGDIKKIPRILWFNGKIGKRNRREIARAT